MNLGNRFSQHSFAQVPTANTPRSKFDRSFAVKDTFDFDYLTPCFLDEILPGDTINLNVKTFMRLAPQVRPIMDNMKIDFYFFFVPNRLVWNNWERFNGAQDDPSDSTDYLLPVVQPGTTTALTVGSMADKFGLPTGVAPASGTFGFNALPFRAYNLIWNEWFRDQNLQQSVSINKTDGPDLMGDYQLKKAAKKHDYFTSALPWPQKGDAVTLPMASTAPVYGLQPGTNPTNHHLYQTQNAGGSRIVGFMNGQTGTPTDVYMTYLSGGVPVAGNAINLATKNQYTAAGGTYAPPYADLADATATSINTFRQAMMMQSFLELDARGGTRYVEILRSHFNVISPDFRLQRPEFLSGGTIDINQHPVAQTSESADTPQGNLAAFSTAAEMGNRIGFSKSFVEHGYVLGLVRARADVTYQQGVNRLWSRRTREDFFWPKFQELGEQAILNKEIYLQSTQANNDLVFGYQERHAEYRYHPSEIRGQFRSTFAQSLDVWHLAEEFVSPPALNDTFIQSNTPIERALVVPDANYPHLLADYWFDYKHVRPMVAYPVPASLGRF